MPPIIDTLQQFLQGYQQRGGGTGGAFRGGLSGASTGATLGSVVPGIGQAVGGAIGGVVGGIGGLVSKKAKTAPTDYAVDDARQILTRAYTELNGRPPAPGDVDSMIAGQGWKPGHRWVGSGGLQSVLSSLQQNAPKTQAAAAPMVSTGVNARTGIDNSDPSRAAFISSLRGGQSLQDALIARLSGGK